MVLPGFLCGVLKWPMGKAEDTKARVERAALTLFVARGVAETTTKEIAMAASIAEGTIYRYFPSKEQPGLELPSSATTVRWPRR